MNENKALLFGLAAVTGWSTVATAFKFTLGHVDTHQLLFYANLTAAAVLLLITGLRGQAGSLLPCMRDHWQITLAAAALNPVIYYQLLFLAYDQLPAQAAMSINYTWAIVMSVMAVVFLKQRLIAADFVAALICYGGVVVIATGGNPATVTGVNMTGVLLALASTFIWAGYWTLNVKDNREPVVGLTLNFIVALPATAAVCAWLSEFEVGLTGLLGSAYVGVAEMAVGFVLWSSALRLSSNAARVSNLIFLSPILSLVFIATVLGEEILAATVAGLALILGGLVIQQLAHRKLEAGESD